MLGPVGFEGRFDYDLSATFAQPKCIGCDQIKQSARRADKHIDAVKSEVIKGSQRKIFLACARLKRSSGLHWERKTQPAQSGLPVKS